MATLREQSAEGKGPSLELRAHPLSALAGAIGAALWGAYRARRLAELGVSLEGAPA